MTTCPRPFELIYTRWTLVRALGPFTPIPPAFSMVSFSAGLHAQRSGKRRHRIVADDRGCREGGGSGWGGTRELSCMAQGLCALEAQGVGQRWKTGPCYWPFADPPPPDALRTHPPTSPPVTPRPLEALPLPSFPFPQLQTGQTRKNKKMTGQRCRSNCHRERL